MPSQIVFLVKDHVFGDDIPDINCFYFLLMSKYLLEICNLDCILVYTLLLNWATYLREVWIMELTFISSNPPALCRLSKLAYVLNEVLYWAKHGKTF